MINVADLAEFAAAMAIICIPVVAVVAGGPLARALAARLSQRPKQDNEAEALTMLEARLFRHPVPLPDRTPTGGSPTVRS